MPPFPICASRPAFAGNRQHKFPCGGPAAAQLQQQRQTGGALWRLRQRWRWKWKAKAEAEATLRRGYSD